MEKLITRLKGLLFLETFLMYKSH